MAMEQRPDYILEKRDRVLLNERQTVALKWKDPKLATNQGREWEQSQSAHPPKSAEVGNHGKVTVR